LHSAGSISAELGLAVVLALIVMSMTAYFSAFLKTQLIAAIPTQQVRRSVIDTI
jgi:hypothetical protein